MQFRDSELEMEVEAEGGLHEGPLGEGPLGEGAYGEGPQGEEFLGGLIGSLLGEGEEEYEAFGAYGEGPLGEGPLGEGPMGEGPLGEGPLGEGAYGEGPQGEEFLGGLVSSLLGEGEGPLGESEDEQFFGKLLKRVPALIRRVAPVLQNVVKTAAPLVAGAAAGPLGGTITKLAGSFLGEGEMEDEYEGEGEAFGESPAHEAPLTHQQAMGELMAAIASKSQTDMEAEAMAGAATVITLSAADRAALRSVLPSLIRATSILTRVLRRHRYTRPAVRTVPLIIRRTAQQLQRRAASGQPVTKRTAARAIAKQTQRVLSNPRTCTHAIQNNMRTTRAVTRSSRRQQRQARYI